MKHVRNMPLVDESNCDRNTCNCHRRCNTTMRSRSLSTSPNRSGRRINRPTEARPVRSTPLCNTVLANCAWILYTSSISFSGSHKIRGLAFARIARLENLSREWQSTRRQIVRSSCAAIDGTSSAQCCPKHLRSPEGARHHFPAARQLVQLFQLCVHAALQ
jgi:hypothetical protein